MEEFKERDVVRTVDGVEVTIVEVFHEEPFYLAETNDDKLVYLKSTDVEGIVSEEEAEEGKEVENEE